MKISVHKIDELSPVALVSGKRPARDMAWVVHPIQIYEGGNFSMLLPGYVIIEDNGRFPYFKYQREPEMPDYGTVAVIVYSRTVWENHRLMSVSLDIFSDIPVRLYPLDTCDYATAFLVIDWEQGDTATIAAARVSDALEVFVPRTFLVWDGEQWKPKHRRQQFIAG